MNRFNSTQSVVYVSLMCSLLQEHYFITSHEQIQQYRECCVRFSDVFLALRALFHHFSCIDSTVHRVLCTFLRCVPCFKSIISSLLMNRFNSTESAVYVSLMCSLLQEHFFITSHEQIQQFRECCERFSHVFLASRALLHHFS